MATKVVHCVPSYRSNAVHVREVGGKKGQKAAKGVKIKKREKKIKREVKRDLPQIDDSAPGRSMTVSRDADREAEVPCTAHANAHTLTSGDWKTLRPEKPH